MNRERDRSENEAGAVHNIAERAVGHGGPVRRGYMMRLMVMSGCGVLRTWKLMRLRRKIGKCMGMVDRPGEAEAGHRKQSQQGSREPEPIS